jgi:hypothetical protein
MKTLPRFNASKQRAILYRKGETYEIPVAGLS